MPIFSRSLVAEKRPLLFVHNIIIKAFSEVESAKATKAVYKANHDVMRLVGASMHAVLYAAEPIIAFK